MDMNVLRDKIYGCWLGKNIGGTLGAPIEGRCDFMDIKWFPELGEKGCIPNDDLDLQLLNLHALEHYGPSLRAEQLGRQWAEHNYFPVDEYGYAVTNLRRGLQLPLAGCYNNIFTSCMGSPIRSEIWAVICAGRPKLAAFYAWQDAVVDHAGGEGIYGEIFNAAIEALAFTSSDIFYLVDEALKYIPTTCRVYQAVSDTMKWYKEGVSYEELRPKILAKHGSHELGFTDAPQNIAFMLIGFLYADNFGDGMLKVANYGYDTDCTVATFAALYGIMYGTAGIPAKWADPIGDLILLSKEVRGFNCPANLDELTDRTIRLYNILLQEDENDPKYTITDEDFADYEVQHYTLPEGELREEAIWVTLKMDQTPGITPGSSRSMNFRIRNNTFAPWGIHLSVTAPAGCIVNTADADVTLDHGEEANYPVTVSMGADYAESQATFVLNVDRQNEEGLWKRYYVPFVLIRTSHWTVDGKEVDIDGNIICFEPGDAREHVATTKYYTSKKRMSRFYISTVQAVRLFVDGKQVLDGGPFGILRNSYSTLCPPDHEVEFELEAGVHDIRIETYGGGERFVTGDVPTDRDTVSFCFTAKKCTTPEGGRPLVAYELIDNYVG